MEIDVDLDWVRINGYTVMRPPNIARSAWLEYWEWVKANGPKI